MHGNWEALQAVLADIDGLKPDRIICLGDSVGYGPDSARCFDLLRRRSAILLAGNHERALQDGRPEDFHEQAAAALDVARSQLESRGRSGDIEKRLERLEEIGHFHQEGDILFVHGSPLDPCWDYIFPSYVREEWDREHLRSLFEKIQRICFCGHSHCPCVIGDDLECWWPEGDDLARDLDPGRKYIINVGSVGQPRDGDPRSCYVLHDGGRVEFRRVPYAINVTMEKILRTEGLPPECADRLEQGI